MDELRCQYCNKEFTTKANLNYHIKNAKFCLDKRGIKNEDVTKYNCEYCQKTFTTKRRLETHLKICLEFEKNIKLKDEKMSVLENSLIEKDKIITELRLQIENLNDRIERLCNKAIERPTITQNQNTKTDSHNITNTYNHLQPINLSYDHLYQVLDKNLKLEHIYQGQIGLANVVANKLLIDENGKPLAFCNDKSRQIIKYKNEGGELIKDVKAYNLVSSIAPVAEQIAMKRKKEFEISQYPNSPTSKDKDEEKEYDEEYLDIEDEEDEEFFGFEDEEEFDETISKLQKEVNKERKKEKVETIIKCIDENEEWDEEKKTYYLQKLIKGITDLKILNVNPTLFTKQLSMILPSDIKNVE